MNRNKEQGFKTQKIRNCSIDLFRYVCAVMVVAIHTDLAADINGKLGYFCAQVFPRIGVPFFFAVAGFFYIQRIEKGEQIFFFYIKKLLFVYLIWSVPYSIINYLQQEPEDMMLFIRDSVGQFLIPGITVHFWFFPALILSVCITTLCFRLGFGRFLYAVSLLLYGVGCLGCSYHGLGTKLPLLANLYAHPQFLQIRRILMMGLPFFLAGYLVYRIKDRVLVPAWQKWIFPCWLGSVILWLGEIALVRVLKWEVNIYITFGLYLLLITTLLLLLKNPLPQYRKAADSCRMLANFTYYAHPAVILVLTVFCNRIPEFQLTETPKFLLTVGITLVGGLICRRLDNKWINRIMNY